MTAPAEAATIDAARAFLTSLAEHLHDELLHQVDTARATPTGWHVDAATVCTLDRVAREIKTHAPHCRGHFDRQRDRQRDGAPLPRRCRTHRPRRPPRRAREAVQRPAGLRDRGQGSESVRREGISAAGKSRLEHQRESARRAGTAISPRRARSGALDRRLRPLQTAARAVAPADSVTRRRWSWSWLWIREIHRHARIVQD